MAAIMCQTCGALYSTTDTLGAYYFSSTTTYFKGDYASPALIAAAGEDMETCPRDTAQAKDSAGKVISPSGATPGGGSMMRGDDRHTAGDETDPDRDNLPPLRAKDDVLEGA